MFFAEEFKVKEFRTTTEITTIILYYYIMYIVYGIPEQVSVKGFFFIISVLVRVSSPVEIRP